MPAIRPSLIGSPLERPYKPGSPCPSMPISSLTKADLATYRASEIGPKTY